MIKRLNSLNNAYKLYLIKKGNASYWLVKTFFKLILGICNPFDFNKKPLLCFCIYYFVICVSFKMKFKPASDIVKNPASVRLFKKFDWFITK